MKALLKRYALDLLLFIAVVVVLSVIDRPLIPYETWDLLATIGWTCIPFALCWLLLVLGKYLKPVLVAYAALLDANMWDVRHETKYKRTNR